MKTTAILFSLVTLLTSQIVFAKVGDAVKVCGIVDLYTDDGDNTYSSIKTDTNTFVLVVQETEGPKAVSELLIAYHYKAASSLKVGNTVCAVGLEADTKRSSSGQITELLHWVISSQKN